MFRFDAGALTVVEQGSRPKVALALHSHFRGRQERTETAQFRTSAVPDIRCDEHRNHSATMTLSQIARFMTAKSATADAR
jgi:hypothetical protein